MDIETVKHRLGLGENGQAPPVLQGIALDGRSIRDAQKFGEKVHLLSLMRHEPPVILEQVEVGEKEIEILITPALLAEVDLRHKVVTAGALQTQWELCAQIQTQGGDYLADAKTLERLWREHWAIENRVHYVQDVSMGEDAGRAHRGNTPVVLAVLRNLVLSLLRLTGWDSISNAFRYYRTRLYEPLQLLGHAPRTDGL